MKLNLTELTTSDIHNYYKFTNQFASYSDINFTSLISWCPNVLFHLDTENLYLSFDDYTSDNTILTGMSLNPKEFIPRLINVHNKIPNSVIDTLPGSLIQDIKDRSLRSKFKVSEDQSDYVYNSSTQLDPVGSKFSWHRRKLSIFNRSNPDNEIVVSRNISEEETKIFTTIWTEWKEASNLKEIDAVKRYISCFDKFLNQYIIKIYINNQLEGFAFCELVESIHAREFLIHFFKSNINYEGLSNYLFSEIVKVANSYGVNIINFEQDLAEPGLRYYKQHLRPDNMLDKYHLIPDLEVNNRRT